MRKVFYSFDYKPDVFRVQQVRNMGIVSDKPLLSANKWEEVRQKGGSAIKKWIDDNMVGRSCVVVLVGSNTANKKWVKYEIKKAWNDGKGLVGIYINNLKCAKGGYSAKGLNPFAQFNLDGKPLSSVVKCYTPPIFTIESILTGNPISKGKAAYKNIEENIEDLVEEAIIIRSQYK